MAKPGGKQSKNPVTAVPVDIGTVNVPRYDDKYDTDFYQAIYEGPQGLTSATDPKARLVKPAVTPENLLTNEGQYTKFAEGLTGANKEAFEELFGSAIAWAQEEKRFTDRADRNQQKLTEAEKKLRSTTAELDIALRQYAPFVNVLREMYENAPITGKYTDAPRGDKSFLSWVSGVSRFPALPEVPSLRFVGLAERFGIEGDDLDNIVRLVISTNNLEGVMFPLQQNKTQLEKERADAGRKSERAGARFGQFLKNVYNRRLAARNQQA